MTSFVLVARRLSLLGNIRTSKLNHHNRGADKTVRHPAILDHQKSLGAGGFFICNVLLASIMSQHAHAYFLRDSCTRNNIHTEMIHEAIAGAVDKAQLVVDTYRTHEGPQNFYVDDLKQLKDWIFGPEAERPKLPPDRREKIPESYEQMAFQGDANHPSSGLRQYEQGVLPSSTGDPAIDKDLRGTMIFCEVSPALIEVRNNPGNPANAKGKFSMLRQWPQISWYGDGLKNCNYFENKPAFHVRELGGKGQRSAVFLCPWYLQVVRAMNIKTSERFFGALKKPLQSLDILRRKLGGNLLVGSRVDIDALALFDRVLFHELTHTWNGGLSKDVKWGWGEDVTPDEGPSFPNAYGWGNARLIGQGNAGSINADSLAIFAFATELLVRRNMQIGPNGEVTGRVRPQKSRRGLVLRGDDSSVETLSWDQNYHVFVKALGEIGIDESEVEKMLNSTNPEVRM